MKYKVGDVVKLKSKEELEKVGWSKYCATELEGAKLNILGIVHDLYITVQDEREYHFGDDAVKELISESEKDNIYTFEELKARVDDLKKYLTGYVIKNRSLIAIELETNDVAEVNSLIKIIN